MSNDEVNSWKRSSSLRNKADQRSEIPGDTDATDIVGRTGEQMPEVAHDEVTRDTPHRTRTKEQAPERPGIDAQDSDRMPRAEDDDATRAGSPEFHDRPGSGNRIGDRHRVFDNLASSRARDAGAEAEGQLGPDELPDPHEVIMNQEAKLHH